MAFVIGHVRFDEGLVYLHTLKLDVLLPAHSGYMCEYVPSVDAYTQEQLQEFRTALQPRPIERQYAKFVLTDTQGVLRRRYRGLLHLVDDALPVVQEAMQLGQLQGDALQFFERQDALYSKYSFTEQDIPRSQLTHACGYLALALAGYSVRNKLVQPLPYVQPGDHARIRAVMHGLSAGLFKTDVRKD